LTLIELAATFAILTVLACLVLPALQSAREAARRVACVNNVKQIALAIQNYSALHGVFPPIVSQIGGPPPTRRGGLRSAHSFSPLARMLSELEQAPLFHSVNLSVAPHDVIGLESNLTAMATSLSVAICPSDGAPSVGGYGRNNYRFNVGYTHRMSPSPTDPLSWSGPFTVHLVHAPAAFTDGLSNTIGVSERCQGDWTKGLFKRWGDYALSSPPARPTSPAAAVAWCESIPWDAPVESRAGESWFLSGFHFTSYNHCLPPNPAIRDCALELGKTEVWERAHHAGVFSAASRHPGGVVCATMDGGVRFVRSTISPAVWAASASRNGGEAAGLPGE
jgi:type II secretory pathway pseudopilin PulG